MPVSATTFIKTIIVYHLGVMYIEDGNVTAATVKVAMYLYYRFHWIYPV